MRNKALLSDKLSAALQGCRRARRYVIDTRNRAGYTKRHDSEFQA